MSKFEEIYKKVLDADKKFKEQCIPINLDFKIEDFRDALIESNDKIDELKSRIKFLNERVKEQDNALQWHKVEVLMGKLVGELPNRNKVIGDRCFLVHFQIIQKRVSALRRVFILRLPQMVQGNEKGLHLPIMHKD